MADPNRAIVERARRRRAAWVTGLLLAALLVTFGVSSFAWALASSPWLRLFVVHGRIGVEWSEPPIANWEAVAGLTEEPPRIDLKFDVVQLGGAIYARVPLTWPVGISAFFFVAMLYRLRTYRDEDHCGGCGYLLKGLKPVAGETRRCPECGRTDGEGA
ncbi:MAG: hypothetical protein ACOYN0_02785 [Phycisphaerales bacterium]